MIDIINKSWSWAGVAAEKIIDTNDFGNIIFQSTDGKYLRICPEELYCKIIANNQAEFDQLRLTKEFVDDWGMTKINESTKKELGNLNDEEKYCLKLPTVFGGLYEVSNLGKILHKEQIRISGELGFQIKDFPDGQKIEFNI